MRQVSVDYKFPGSQWSAKAEGRLRLSVLLTSYDYHGLPLFMTLSLSSLFVHNLADSALGLSQAPKLSMLTSAHRNGAWQESLAVLYWNR